MALNFLLKRSNTSSKRPDPIGMAFGELALNYADDTGGIFFKNVTGDVVKIGPAEVGATAPNSSPVGSAGNSLGEFWYDTSSSTLKLWDGTAWASISGGGGITSVSGTSPISVDNTSPSAPVISVSAATTSAQGVVQVGSNIQVSSGTISVNSGSTTQPGVVQLNDTTSSTSTSLALTANQGYNLQQQINALSVSSNIILAGTIDASTGLVDSVTSSGTAQGFAVGSPLPAASVSNQDYFVIVDVEGTMTPPGGSSTPCQQGDWFLSTGTSWSFLGVGFNAALASTSAPGIVQLATDAEVQAGLNTTNAVVPYSLQSKVSDSISTTSSATIASSTAVKTAYDLADAAIAKSVVTAKGDLIAGTGSAAVTALGVGTNGQFLTADSACASGLKWTTITQCTGTVTSVTAGTGLSGGTITGSGTLTLNTACVIQPTILTAKGSLISASAASTPVALGVGSDGQVLTACSACASGLTWAAGGGGGGASPATPTSSGTVLGCTTVASGPTPGKTALGCNALLSLTTGLYNTAIGENSSCAVTTGYYNTAVGFHSLKETTTGKYNTAVGWCAMGNSNSSYNTAVGWKALSVATTGLENVAVGMCNMVSMTTGSDNTGVGSYSLTGLTSGAQNAVVGSFAAMSLTTGSQNTGMGDASLSNVTGNASRNTALGWAAGARIGSGCSNVAIGYCASVPTLNGSCQLAIGWSSTCCWLTGDSTKAIRPAAGITDCTGSTGTLGQVLTSNGANAIAWGSPATATPTSFGTVKGCTTVAAGGVTARTSLGCNALLSVTTGDASTAIGENAACATTTGGNNVAVGFHALKNNTTGGYNTIVGTCAGSNGTGSYNTVVGYWAMRNNTSASRNIAIGCSALLGLSGGTDNIAIGNLAQSASSPAASSNISVGHSALATFTSGSGNIAIGNCANCSAVSSTGNTVIGFFAGGQLQGSSGNVVIGYCTAVPVANGSNQLAIGFSATCNWITGDSTKAIKPGAGIIDCAGSCGVANQVLCSTGLNSVQWTTPSYLPLASVTTTSTTATQLLALVASTFRGVIVNVSVTDTTGGKYYTDIWQIVHNGTTTNVVNNPGARIGTSPYSLSATIVSGNLLVRVTSTTTNSTKYVGSYQAFTI